MPYWDIMLLIMLLLMVLGMAARMRLDAAYRKYSQISARCNVTAAEIARKILDKRGAPDVEIVMADARALTDYYDPRTKTLVLSEPIHHGYSIAALGVAAHEAGHALQHAEGYGPFSARSAIVPLANFGSNASMPLLLLGFAFSWTPLLWAGIALYALAVLFQLITLPVEFNASSRALEALEVCGGLTREEVPGAKKVLNAAALTYVAAALAALAQLIRLLLLASSGRRRR